MARLIFSLLILISGAAQATDPRLFGRWQFDSLRYQGQEMPRPNPDLILIFEFREDGTDRLSWTRRDETGFCDRTAVYSAADGVLQELVVWVHPGNRGDCAQDPDMQLGRQASVPYRVENGRLELDLPLSDETLTYLWVPVPADQAPALLRRPGH